MHLRRSSASLFSGPPELRPLSDLESFVFRTAAQVAEGLRLAADFGLGAEPKSFH